MSAIWLDIPGFSRYRLSSEGIVVNKRTGNRVKSYIPHQRGDCSARICLYNDFGKRPNVLLKRLVCEIFNEQAPFPGMLVDYIDGDKNNLKASNLIWVTVVEYERNHCINRTRKEYLYKKEEVKSFEQQKAFLSMRW